MNKSIYRIFSLPFSLILFFTFLNAHAQYDEYFRFTDVRATVVYNYAFEDVIDTDAKILKKNKVKEVTAKNEDGILISKMLINAEGWAENFSTNEYGNKEINYKLIWDELGLVTNVIYTEDNRDITYAFGYKNNFIDVIHADFGIGGLAEDYIFFPKDIDGKPVPDKISYRDTYKDTIYMTCLFNYTSEGKVVSVYHEKFPDSPVDSVSYEGSSVYVEKKYYSKRKFEIKDERILREEISIPDLQPAHANYIKDNKRKEIVTTKNYFYKENGLIDYIQLGSDGGKIIYEYSFYN
jgi:hypothetical protein